MSKRSHNSGLLAAALLAAAGLAAAAPEPAQLERLDRLTRDAVENPAPALRSLQALRQEAGFAAPSPSLQIHLKLAEARVWLAAGEAARSQALATELGQAGPEGAALAQLLAAELAMREGQLGRAAELARQSLLRLEADCPRESLKEAIRQQRCDYRNTWLALRLLGRQQSSEGAQALAETTNRQAMALAEAAGDAFLTALSMAGLAVINQTMGLQDQARRWMTLALQTAQGDALITAHIKNYEVAVAARSGDQQAQMRALEEGLALARQADAPMLMAQMQTGLADVYIHTGQPARALATAEPALKLVLSRRHARMARVLRNNIAVALIQLHQFDRARRELALLAGEDRGQGALIERIYELREQGEAWAAAGQAKEAIAAFHEERKLSAAVNARNREASLQQLKIKYDSDRKQRDLELLKRDKALVDHQLANRHLASQVGYAVAALLGLSLILGAVMVRRVRQANKRLKANELLLRAQSERDPLTDLANRRHFLGVMAEQAQHQFSGALLMVDIDHFKHVNDQHGHGVGDVVICEVARRLSHAVRAGDLVVRWGGEEFLVFAADVSPEQLAVLAERILQVVSSEPVATGDGALRVTVSVGFAHFPLPPARLALHWEQAVNWADMALYSAKSRGRNRAMGIATVQACDRSDLSQIEANFEAACSSERVHLRQILGPVAP